MVIQRSSNIGCVPPIVVGEEFRYHYQLMLAWLHNHNIRGLCDNLLNQIATAIVIKYSWKNFDVEGVGNEMIYIGGEGGLIAEPHNLGHRVLER